MRITDYHREVVAIYYKRIIDQYGLAALLKHIETLAHIVWSDNGLRLVERRVRS